MQANFEHCTALVREADHDRYVATLFAPAEHRDPLSALYAFNVEITRVRDLAHQALPGEIRLQWWREVLQGDRASEAAAHPVAAALTEVLARYELSADPLQALIDSHTFDLYEEPMASLLAFDDYAEKTRASLFNMATAILGGLAPETQTLARHAGIAYAVASVLSNLPLHAVRRQLYLPQDLLGRNGVVPEAVFAREDSAGLQAALTELRTHAREHLATAGRTLDSIPVAALPALLPVATVKATFAVMERPNYQPFQFEPPSRLRRQWQLWRAARDPRRIFRG